MNQAVAQSAIVDRPALSIGVVTHERALALGKLLMHLRSALQLYPVRCELIVINNSGVAANKTVAAVVEASGVSQDCSCRIVDSPENSISVGRNLILQHATMNHIVFVDDDEYPVPAWLVSLVDTMSRYDCAMVAGPIMPVYPPDTARWIRSVDLHNCGRLKTGETLDYAAAGNFLLNRAVTGQVLFDTDYGKSGGEDTEYFLRLKDQGHSLRWCSEAIVHEDVPPEKAGSVYMLRRFMTQGMNYRRILESRQCIRSEAVFILRAACLFLVSGIIGLVLLIFQSNRSGNWLKRSLSNLGKIVQLEGHLYG